MIGDLTLDFRECFEPQVLMRLNGSMLVLGCVFSSKATALQCETIVSSR